MPSYPNPERSATYAPAAAMNVMQNPLGTLNPACMIELSLDALPPTSPSPAPAASASGTMHGLWEPTAGPLENG